MPANAFPWRIYFFVLVVKDELSRTKSRHASYAEAVRIALELWSQPFPESLSSSQDDRAGVLDALRIHFGVDKLLQREPTGFQAQGVHFLQERATMFNITQATTDQSRVVLYAMLQAISGH